MTQYFVYCVSPFIEGTRAAAAEADDMRAAIKLAAADLIAQHKPFYATVAQRDLYPECAYYEVTENGSIRPVQSLGPVSRRLLTFWVVIEGLFEARARKQTLAVDAVNEKQAAVRARALAGFYKVPCHVTVRRIFSDDTHGPEVQFISGGSGYSRLSRYPKPGSRRKPTEL